MVARLSYIAGRNVVSTFASSTAPQPHTYGFVLRRDGQQEKKGKEKKVVTIEVEKDEKEEEEEEEVDTLV